MSSQAVFLLRQVVDDPRFEGFGFAKRQKSLLGNKILEDDFIPTGWDVPELLPLWKTPKVKGRVRKFNDFPCIDLTIPAFSERSVAALGEFLTSAGELLPLNSDSGTYYAFHNRTVVESLVISTSEIIWFSTPPKRVLDIERFEFDPDTIKEHSVFTIPEMPTKLFVTQRFIERIEEAQLRGFDCPKLWPLPPSTNWRMYRKPLRDHQVESWSSAAKDISRNSLALKLPIDDVEMAPNERASLEQILDELDQILIDVNSEKEPVGTVDGFSCVEGNIEVWMSCPDADALANHLTSWLNRLKWRNGFTLVKRYGERIDCEARQEEVKFNM